MKGWPPGGRVWPMTPYGGKVWLFIDRTKCNQARASICVDAIDHDAVGSAAHGADKKTDDPVYIVGVFDGCTSTLVHELAHVALWVTAHAGFKPTAGGGEPFCYLLDHLFITMRGHLRRKPRRSK